MSITGKLDLLLRIADNILNCSNNIQLRISGTPLQSLCNDLLHELNSKVLLFEKSVKEMMQENSSKALSISRLKRMEKSRSQIVARSLPQPKKSPIYHQTQLRTINSRM